MSGGPAIQTSGLSKAYGSGRRALATGVAIVAWLINSFAPLVSGLNWLKYLSLSTPTPATTH